MKNRINILLIISMMMLSLLSQPSRAQEVNFDNCWRSQRYATLLDTVQKAMNKPIEDTYKQHDFIQTFGCAYEEDDIEENSIRAVYRAIIQSIRNRKLSLRDDLDSVLRSRPPRPDNLARDYSIYVNIPTDAAPRPARYEIKILNLEAVPTVESEKAVWTRIVTRYAYKEDFNVAPIAAITPSEFVKVMEESQVILRALERKKFAKVRKILAMENVSLDYPKSIADLMFGDSMILFDEVELEKTYPGIYLGKGIFACETPTNGVVICKFGEERLYHLRVDNSSFRRTVPHYAELNYQAPESILQCIFLKFCHEKPRSLPILGTIK
ncbi:MAG: hypothetical protein ONB16_04420 [candidate division KSB1 bacterium]|nr:hypothetical protein [candidate division KSB1 bacterium]MDZ7319437.1 hypothetical protein [candidate division KSB1 bacterium]MDZ7340629.1 hypothetical protein [candidate division KSB1 bacterium]